MFEIPLRCNSHPDIGPILDGIDMDNWCCEIPDIHASLQYFGELGTDQFYIYVVIFAPDIAADRGAG